MHSLEILIECRSTGLRVLYIVLHGQVFGLPGCFTLYHWRAFDTHKPPLIFNRMVQDYSQNCADILHMKNTLRLGEDRYLITLLLKHFPMHKTQFVCDAHAFTVAPSDRRGSRFELLQCCCWINLGQLCGFCCFSMRFVVTMIDLVSTIVQRITVGCHKEDRLEREEEA